MNIKTPDEALELCREIVERWAYDAFQTEQIKMDELSRLAAAFEKLDEFVVINRELPHAWQR